LKKKKKPVVKKKTGSETELDEELSDLDLSEAQSFLQKEMGSTELNLMSAWSSVAKIAQHNHAKIQHRASQIQKNEAAIQALERQFHALTQSRSL